MEHERWSRKFTTWWFLRKKQCFWSTATYWMTDDCEYCTNVRNTVPCVLCNYSNNFCLLVFCLWEMVQNFLSDLFPIFFYYGLVFNHMRKKKTVLVQNCNYTSSLLEYKPLSFKRSELNKRSGRHLNIISFILFLWKYPY